MPVVEELKPPEEPKARNVERLHVTLPSRLKDKLDELQESTYATSASDVIKDALILYASLIEEHRNGKEVVVKDPSGQDSSYRLFLRS